MKQHVTIPILLFFCFQVTAQIVLEEKCISCDFEFPLNEPHLVVDPQNPNHLLVGAIATRSWEKGSEPNSYIVLFQTKDAGVTWKMKQFDKGFALGADPWLAINNRGTMVLSSLSRIDGLKAVYLTTHISRNSGDTWLEDFHNLGFNHDRQSIVVDDSSNEFIIVSAKANRNIEGKNIWGLAVNRLSAGGSLIESTWHEISNIDKMNGTPILSDNSLFVPFVDYMVNDRMLESKRSWIIRSFDKGKTFMAPKLLSEKGIFPKVVMGQNKILYYLQLKDGGSLAELKYSKDNGYTWESIGDLISYEDKSIIIKTPEIVINEQGIVAVFWHKFNKKTNEYQLKSIFAKENNLQFKEAINISSVVSRANSVDNGMVDERWPTGGDYFGLSSLPNGNFILVWVDHRNGKPQLFKAVVDFLGE